MNAGAIAGGVVGGLAAVVLIIGAIMFFVRRGQSKDSSAANGNGVTSQSVAGSGPSPPPPTSPSPAYNSGVPASLNSTAPLVGGGASGGTFYDNRASMVQPPQYGYEQQRTPSPQPQMQQTPYGMQQPMQPNQFLQPGQYPNSPTSAFAQPTQQQTYYGSPGSGPSSSGTENAAYFSPLTPQQMHHMPELDSTEANLNAPKEMAA